MNKQDLEIDYISVPGYEKVIKIIHQKSGLRAIIAIHSTSLGKALGGTRIFPYASFDLALTDALRLAKGMTYKSAIAATGFGGGKGVIIANPETEKSNELLLAYADAINILNGEFITAEDSGSEEKDLVVMSKRTKYIAGLPYAKGSGNPSRFTAWGTFRGIQAIMKKLYGSDSVKNRKINIQGIGCVGEYLVDFLFWAGADISITDVREEAVKRILNKYAVKAVQPDEIYGLKCDVFAPCAFGGVINDKTIELLNCKAVAGAANNQLLSDVHGEDLKRRGILYAPDFVINGAGVINVALEMAVEGYNPRISQMKADNVYDSILRILEIAEQKNVSTNKAAITLAEEYIQKGIGKASHPPVFHCIH